MNKLLTLLGAFLLLSSHTLFAQGVTGKVTNSKDGTPLGGASVRIKGTSIGTSTNADGSFSLPISDSVTEVTLEISGIGFGSKDVVAKNGESVTVSLDISEKNLSEVIVTALGITRSRNTLPYAAQQISGSEVNKTVTTNFVDNLSGKIAGLQITSSNTMGGTTNAILRGMKSLTQSNQALFVVDGVPFDNANQSTVQYDLGNVASDINPDDIESITVLKGAAASALYGSRASNGVILITTKKGMAHVNKALGITASFGVTVGSMDKSTLPTYQTQYGQGYFGAGNDPGTAGDRPGSFFYGPLAGGGPNVLISQMPYDAATGPAFDKNIEVYQWDAFSPGNPNFGKPTPWVSAPNHNPEDFFVTPVTTSANLAVDGGGPDGTFRLGITRDDDKDYMPNAHDTKTLLNFTGTHNLNDKVTVGASANYSEIDAIGRYTYAYGNYTNIMGDFRQWWPTNVDIKELKADYFRTKTNATWNWLYPDALSNTAGNIAHASYHDNPYWDRYQNAENDSRNRIFGNVFANYKITSYLNLLGRVSTDYYTQLIETKNNIGSTATPYYDRYNQTYDETNYDVLLNFNKDVSNSFNVKALLGGNIRQNDIQSVEGKTSGGLVVPGFYALSNSVNTPAAPTEITDTKEVDGVFAGATVTFKDMVSLDGTVRRDQSSTLPSSTNAYYYPSVSASFEFSKLLPSLDWLSHAKVWANYAEVGGDAPYYSVQNTYSINPPINGQTISSAAETNNNPNLKPEENKTYEFGLEAYFLKNRIGFSGDYYKSQQINEITPANISQATGYSSFFVNAGTIQNEGVELTINATPILTTNFSWDVAINWSKNVNKILSLYNNQPSYVIQQEQNSVNIVAEQADSAGGKTIKNGYGIITGTDYVYLNGQRVVDANGHYEIAPNSKSNIGNINPDWMGGISNTFKYKNVALSFLVDVRQGGDVYSLDMDYGSLSGLYPRTAGYNDLGNPVRSALTGDNTSGGLILKGVTADGQPNTKRIDESATLFSSAQGNAEAARQFVYDASYVKLREAALTYSLPKSILGKISFIKGIDISFAGRNLWIIHKNLPYSDPEQGQALGVTNGQNASMGFQSGAFPTVRTFALILKLKF
jgi:TonB-linked SusC/RagA family outer membrane protein